jgi:hypothetical protein
LAERGRIHHPQENDMAGRDAWLQEMVGVLAQDMEDNPEEYRAIAKMMAEKDGGDPERLYQWFVVGFKKMAAQQ